MSARTPLIASRERGFFGIGIITGKSAVNVGTLWRSAFSLGAAFIFTAGRRYPRQAADTVQAYKHVPLLQFPDVETLWEAIPYSCVPVAVEVDERARPIANYVHPERAIYLLGAEDNGLPKFALERARDVIQVPGRSCLNVAVTGSIVMYDRIVKSETSPRLPSANGSRLTTFRQLADGVEQGR